MKRFLPIFLLLLTSTAGAAEVKLALPQDAAPNPIPVPTVIQPGQFVPIPISGMTVEEAKKSQVIVYPRDGVLMMPVCDWSGNLSILFSAQTAGKYLVVICTANQQGGVDKVEAELVVGGVNPPKPPDPPKPPEPPVGKAVSVIGVVDGLSPSNAPWKGSSIIAAMNAHGGQVYTYSTDEVRVKSTPDLNLRWIGSAAGKPLPFVFVASAEGKVLWQGQPTNEASLLSVITPLFGPSNGPPIPSCPGGLCPERGGK